MTESGGTSAKSRNEKKGFGSNYNGYLTSTKSKNSKEYVDCGNLMMYTTSEKEGSLSKKEARAMVDMNTMIASNILALLKKQNKKQTDLAEALGTNKQTVNKMLNGTRMINAVELKAIADYLGVKMEELTRITAVNADTNIVHAFMGKVRSEQAKQALQLADELSDMILFHKKVRENGNAMMVAWEDD